MILKFISSNAKYWRNIVDSWSMLDEANLIASQDGLELRAMDPTRAAMVDFSLLVVAFDTYECEKGPHRLGLNIEEFTKIIKRVSESDILTLELNEPEKVELSFSGNLEKTFGLALLDLGENDYPAPSISSNASMTLLTKTFQSILKDAELVSDYLVIEADEFEFIFKGSSETKDFSTTIEKDHDEVAKFKVKGKHRALYDLNYLKEMTKPNIHDLLKISFSDAMPIEFSYPIPFGGKLSYYYAPRIEV